VPKRTPGTDNRVLRVCRLLNRARVRYLVAGRVAANLHGSVRATKEVDVLVPPDEKNMARLLEALSGLPWGLASELDAAEIARKPVTVNRRRSARRRAHRRLDGDLCTGMAEAHRSTN